MPSRLKRQTKTTGTSTVQQCHLTLVLVRDLAAALLIQFFPKAFQKAVAPGFDPAQPSHCSHLGNKSEKRRDLSLLLSYSFVILLFK